MQAKIEEIITAVEKDSNTIYHYTGYVEKKRGISRADSESSESSDEDVDDCDHVNDTCIEVPSEQLNNTVQSHFRQAFIFRLFCEMTAL